MIKKYKSFFVFSTQRWEGGDKKMLHDPFLKINNVRSFFLPSRKSEFVYNEKSEFFEELILRKNTRWKIALKPNKSAES